MESVENIVVIVDFEAGEKRPERENCCFEKSDVTNKAFLEYLIDHFKDGKINNI